MKKKIILVLSFLMIALYLTGCSVTIDATELEKMTEIANHVTNEKDYTLPEGYTFLYPDATTNKRIVINKSINNDTANLYLEFDTSKDENKLIEIEVYNMYPMNTTRAYIVFILAIIGAVVSIRAAYETIKKLINMKKKR